MKIKSVFITLIILLNFISLKAQPPEVNYSRVSDHISHNYHPDSAMVWKFCRFGSIFVKFNVTPSGDIANLSFGGDADSTKFITDALTIAVNSLKQDTETINLLKRSGRTIIQPVIYIYQAGCNFPKAGNIGKDTVNISTYYLNYINVTTEMDHLYKSFTDMLKFKNGDEKFVDGILLKPISVGLSVMH